MLRQPHKSCTSDYEHCISQTLASTCGSHFVTCSPCRCDAASEHHKPMSVSARPAFQRSEVNGQGKRDSKTWNGAPRTSANERDPEAIEILRWNMTPHFPPQGRSTSMIGISMIFSQFQCFTDFLALMRSDSGLKW